jgi:hypothetical protein
MVNFWSYSNHIPFCPANKSQSEGNGEKKLVRELSSISTIDCVVKNDSGENSFPDLIHLDGTPFGEVKCIMTRKSKDTLVNFGRHSDFSEKVRKILYDSFGGSSKVPFELSKKILGGHLGQNFLNENLTAGRWQSLQKDFLTSYIEATGGRVFLVSPVGWTCVKKDSWDLFRVQAISSSAIRVRPHPNILPFL